MKRLAALVAAQLVVLLACPSARASQQCPNDDVIPAADSADQAAAALACDLNALRAQRALPPLTWDTRLWAGAQWMADDMAREHFFSHTTPDGRRVIDRIEPTGYTPDGWDWLVLENLGWGSGSPSTPGAMANGWMNSEGHRLNLMDPKIRDVGIGVAFGSPWADGPQGIFYVADFGRRGVFALASRHRACVSSVRVRTAFAATCRRRSV